jgi:hypothetical protein
MNELAGRLSDSLLKLWTAHSILIFRGQVHCVEVNVPMLALDAEAVGRAVATSMEYVKNPGYPIEAFAPDVTMEQHKQISDAWRRELTVAENDLTFAAAILARRACRKPMQVRRSCLDQYAARHFWRGGTAPGNSDLVEFLFDLDTASPTVYVSSDALAAVTRYVGTEFLSIRVSEDELRLRVQDAVIRLGQGGPPTPRSLTNMEDWLTREEPEVKDDQDEE